MKRNLNSDGQQFININKQTIASCLKSLNIKMTTTYGIGNPGPGFGQAQTYGGVKLANGIPTLPLLKIDKTDIKKKKKWTDSLPVKKTAHEHRNEWEQTWTVQ